MMITVDVRDQILALLDERRAQYAARFPKSGPEGIREGSAISVTDIANALMTRVGIKRSRAFVASAIANLEERDLVRKAVRRGRNNQVRLYASTTAEERAALAEESAHEAKAARLARALSDAGYKSSCSVGGVVELDWDEMERLFLKAHGILATACISAAEEKGTS